MCPHHLTSIGGDDTILVSGWDPMTSQIRDQEDSPRRIWEDWLRMCSEISCWIWSPCQGNETIKILETIGQPTWERVMGVICNQIGFLLVPSKCQRVRTLTHPQLEMELETKNHRGRDGRRQTQNTAIQCSLSLWQGSCKNMPHLILQNYWLQETRQWEVFQDMGATCKGKETHALIEYRIFMKNKSSEWID